VRIWPFCQSASSYFIEYGSVERWERIWYEVGADMWPVQFTSLELLLR
jgi:hypothetical protein